MIGKTAFRLVFIFVFLVSYSAQAQPKLPDMIGATQSGLNILTWTSQYEAIKSIAVQRSADSVHNFATIGYVKELKKGSQAFIDGHPMPGINWYRLYIVFNSDLTWYSNNIKMKVDSLQLLNQKVLPPNDSLQKYAADVKTIETLTNNKNTTSATATTVVTTISGQPSNIKVVMDTARPTNKIVPKITIPNIASEANSAAYIKSQYVFTNPFTGHVNVEIPDVRKNVFSISFFDEKNHLIFEIPHIWEPAIIIDKRNFQHKGLFKFDLMKNKIKLESGYITIY